MNLVFSFFCFFQNFTHGFEMLSFKSCFFPKIVYVEWLDFPNLDDWRPLQFFPFLTRKAIEELLKEAKRGKTRAETMGPMGW